LKETYHEHFGSAGYEFFSQRPNPTFFTYSARDVEDLTQVQTRMEAELVRYVGDLTVLEKLTVKNLQFYLT
jgi:hypothetical protein